MISDELNHASIIDGVRLCKAQRYRYKNADMADLEAQLQAADAAGARFKLIATDGVFSMDGYIAPLREICDLAERYGALVHVDDSHATGVVGAHGRGTPEHCGVMDRIDIVTGTLGKALGGAWAASPARSGRSSNCSASARGPISSPTPSPRRWSRARPRRSSWPPRATICARSSGDNMRVFREGLEQAGFELLPGEHPIIPVMLHDARRASALADALLKKGVYVIAFSYPVVPKGRARIRTQISATHTREELERAVAAFAEAGRELT